MAFIDDLTDFLQNRIAAFDSTIDLSPGSPAQVQIIQPVLQRFAEDPLSTDIPTFLQDLMVQNFPDLAADGGGLFGDILTKPFQLFLEPFKRQIELLKIGQSVQNASIMSDNEADALGANFFETRNQGGFAGGSVRLYFAQPTTQRVTTDKRVFTADGLNFFPTEGFYITSAQMLFNRQGTRYFMDITVVAETQGDQYNITKNSIIGIDSVSGAVQVTNLSDFTDGAPRDSNEDYLGNFPNVLTERSLVTRRGILARLPDLFSSLSATSVVGAGDPGMNRDLLTGTGQGFLHIAGKAAVYGNWLFVSEVTYKDGGDNNEIIPQVGDSIRFHPFLTGTVINSTHVQEAVITSILTTSSSTGLYLFVLDRTLDVITSPPIGRFALLKPGTITVSGVPGGQTAALVVPDNQVHLGGHTDVFIRPTADTTIVGTLSNVTDGNSLISLTDVAIPTAGQNIVTSAQLGIANNTPVEGDLFVLETGAGLAGTYKILEVGDPDPLSLRLDSVFSSAHTTGDLRARIVRNITVDLIEPHIPKLPFNTGTVSDLNTNVGSNLFVLSDIDIQSFGAAVGDVLRLLNGADAGDFVITGFDGTLGGMGPIVDRNATATSGNISYEVFTAQTGITLPLVRIKTLEVLDTTQQGTGITIPYGDAVDIRPVANFDGAGNAVTILDSRMVVFPDLLNIWGNSPLAPFGGFLADQRPTDVTASTDARYTQKLETPDGIVRSILADPSNPITSIEINLPPFCWNGRRDKLLALTTKQDISIPSTIPGDHQTSDVVASKIGDTLTLLYGPNQGSYVIIDKRVLHLWDRTGPGHREVVLLQVDPELPADPFRTAINLIQSTGGSVSASDLVGLIEWSTDMDNPSSYYASTFLSLLRVQLASLGIVFSNLAGVKAFFDPLVKTGYSIGPSAKGQLRLSFLDPVSAEFYFQNNSTFFEGVTDPSKVFRIDPTLESAQILPESENNTSPTTWLRTLDLDAADPTKVRIVGDSIPAKGITVGDIIEYNPAINDIASRPSMSSSRVAITQAGSNVIRLLLPVNSEINNYTPPQAGQLFFIDSGPDIGAFTITSVDAQDWTASPPNIQIRVDRLLTHTTVDFPSSQDQSGLASGVGAYVRTSGNVFPMSLHTLALHVQISTDSGNTFPTTVSHTFGTGPFNSISDVVSDAMSDLQTGGFLTVFADGSELVIRTTARGPNVQLQVITSTAVGVGLLIYPGALPLVRTGGRGAAAIGNGKRIYGSALTVSLPYITVYSASDPSIIGTPTTDANDIAYLGTFQVTVQGVETAGPFLGENFVELNRSANFPVIDTSSNPALVQWVLHEIPDNTATDTSGGGKQITDQFIRFRMYTAVSKQLTITNIPWSSSPHPLDPTSRDQVVLSGPLLPAGSVNYEYMVPFRILRPGVKRISSTSMALSRDGALYILDLPVVGLGPGPEMNVPTTLEFKLSGNFLIAGYTLQVENTIFTFSSKEQVSIILPKSVLPVGSTPGLNNEFDLAGQSIQITYDNASLVDDIQRFFDSPQDTVLVANTLVRHFLPSYVFLDAFYSGGNSEDVVAAELIAYINNINPDRNLIEASQVVKILEQNGAIGVTLPITITAITHGLDRSIRGMKSEDSIGIDNIPAFTGNFNQNYFIAGPDTSESLVRPSGEQVFLKRT